MSEMITKVAKAMAESAGFCWENCAQSQWERDARAGIDAMRELPEEPGPRYTAGEYSRKNIAAMIDDALSK